VKAAGAGCFVLVVAAMIGAIWWWNIPRAGPPPPPLSAEEQAFGRKPVVLLGEDSVPYLRAVKRHLSQTLKDPESLRFVKTTNPMAKTHMGQSGWVSVVTYRSKNSFGGYVSEEVLVMIRDERIVIWETGK
jgi:hypothetical protein